MSEGNRDPAAARATGQLPETTLAVRRAALYGCALFRSFEPDELDAVLAYTIPRRVPRDAAIMRRGDPGTGMTVILTGRVRVSLTSENGKEVTLAILGHNEVLGEMSLLDGQPCSADAIALEECVVLTVDRDRFLRLLRANHDLCLRLLAVLSGRLRRSNDALENMTSLDIAGRLGRVLSRFAREQGTPVPSGIRLDLKLSQKELGTLIGATRERVNRLLREWEEEGAITKDPEGRMIVVRMDVLERSD